MRRRFKPGHLYTLLWHDHWRMNDASQNDLATTEATIRVRTTGVVLRDTGPSVILESQRALSPDANWRASAHGILKRDIYKIIDHGVAKER